MVPTREPTKISVTVTVNSSCLGCHNTVQNIGHTFIQLTVSVQEAVQFNSSEDNHFEHIFTQLLLTEFWSTVKLERVPNRQPYTVYKSNTHKLHSWER